MPHFNLDFLGGFIIGALITAVWGAWLETRRERKRQQRAATLTLHDSSGFMPDMDVRVSSGDGSNGASLNLHKSHGPSCTCKPCLDERWDRLKRARE